MATLRRIRLQSFAPLPSFRVWFLIPQNVVDVKSLKHSLSTKVSALKGLDIQPAQLLLELDDFELLDECSIDVVREGDILMINAREPVLLTTLKHKADVEKATTVSKRRRVSISRMDTSGVSSSSTSDFSSPDSSPSSSSSASDSEDSKTSITGHKALFPSNNKKPQSEGILHAHRVGAAVIQQPTVPPGLGKSSTQSRNKRRKLKRKYAAAQSSIQKQNLIQSAGVNVDEESPPTGNDDMLEPSIQSSEHPPLPARVPITPRSTIGYKNKSEGFKKAMESTTSQKLVFDTSSVAISSEYTPTFIPPSERDDLPENLFVTNVEINWRTNQGRAGRQDVHEEAETSAPDDVVAVQRLDPEAHLFTDWTAIETAWDKYKTLNASMELLPRTIVAWKAFGLDPVTLTPQASMLHLGKVVSVDVENVLVQPLTRPNIERATFGRVPVADNQEHAQQISQPLNEVWSKEWKLVSHQ